MIRLVGACISALKQDPGAHTITEVKNPLLLTGVQYSTLQYYYNYIALLTLYGKLLVSLLATS